ncbi:hypothetical protein LCGC14_2019710 [marine sediment metagenome]|uniref:Dehydrogenase E1 component domain-containing protein n=1 Tax=marine sediment metagenome TaxID=412755 RepID=A0A0F9HB63_9ZZZZ
MAISHEMIINRGRYRGLSINGVPHQVVATLYRFMQRLRRCQEALIEEYHPADEMRCPVHFCVGQEAVPGALSVLAEQNDYVFSHHRSHGYFLAKGAPMKSLFAEIYGRKTGANGGIAGSQEISYPAVNFFSGAILTGGLAIAVGTALGFKLKGISNVAFTGLGDGAADEGLFWEAINYAVLRKLPVVFLCENNRYATYSHQLKRQPADNISDRVSAFGAKTRALFGNDVIAVYKTLVEATDYARKGKGPFFIEFYTYRWYGHVGPEDDNYLNYRPQREVEFWKTNCPLKLLEEKIFSEGLLTDVEKMRILKEIDDEIADAFKFAKESSFPDNKDWHSLNYATGTPMADKLLREAESEEFNQDQADAIPRPY